MPLGAIAFGTAVLAAAGGYGAAAVARAPGRSALRCPATTAAAISGCLRSTRSGGTILIAPGTYGSLTIDDIHKAVTLAPADRANRPQFTSFTIRRSSGVTIRGVEVIASNDTPFQIGGSDITVDGIELHSQSSDPAQYHKGLFIRDASKVTVTNSWFHDLSSGLTFSGLTDGVLSYNLFTRISDDALFGTYSNHTRITHNFGGSFSHQASDPTHPDYIQIASAFGPNIDLEVSDNVYVRGADGSLSQCVFGGSGRMPPRFGDQPSYLRPVITGNICIGATYNGVGVAGGEDAVVNDNIALPGPDVGSWVAVRGGRVRELNNNVGYVMRGTAVNIVGKTAVATAQGNVLARALSQPEFDALGRAFAAMAKPGRLKGVYEPFRELVLHTVGLESVPQNGTRAVQHCGDRCDTTPAPQATPPS